MKEQQNIEIIVIDYIKLPAVHTARCTAVHTAGGYH